MLFITRGNEAKKCEFFLSIFFCFPHQLNRNISETFLSQPVVSAKAL